MNKNKLLGYAIGPIGSGLIGFVSLPLMVWIFNTEDIGRQAMLWVGCSMMVLFFGLGLDQSYIRDYHEKDDKYTLFLNAFFPGFGLIIFGLILLNLYDENILSRFLYGIDSFTLSLLTSICFLASYINRFLSLILRMQEKSYLFSSTQFFSKLLLILFLIIILISGNDANVKDLILLNTICISGALFVLVYNTKKDIYNLLKVKVDLSLLKSMLIYSFPLYLASIGAWGLYSLDKILLKNLSDFHQLGIYSVSLSFTSISSILASIFNIIWAPLVYKWISNNSIDFLKINKISSSLVALMFFIVTGVGLAFPILKYFLPNDYFDLEYIIIPCLLGPLFYTLAEVTGIGISVTKKTWYSTLVAFLTLFLSIILYYILIPEYGALGASISVVVSFWFYMVLKSYFSAKLWQNIGGKKIYYLTFLVLIISIIPKFIVFYYYIYLVVFVLSLFLFKKDILFICNEWKAK